MNKGDRELENKRSTRKRRSHERKGSSLRFTGFQKAKQETAEAAPPEKEETSAAEDAKTKEDTHTKVSKDNEDPKDCQCVPNDTDIAKTGRRETNVTRAVSEGFSACKTCTKLDHDKKHEHRQRKAHRDQEKKNRDALQNDEPSDGEANEELPEALSQPEKGEMRSSNLSLSSLPSLIFTTSGTVKSSDMDTRPSKNSDEGNSKSPTPVSEPKLSIVPEPVSKMVSFELALTASAPLYSSQAHSSFRRL